MASPNYFGFGQFNQMRSRSCFGRYMLGDSLSSRYSFLDISFHSSPMASAAAALDVSLVTTVTSVKTTQSAGCDDYTYSSLFYNFDL